MITSDIVIEPDSINPIDFFLIRRLSSLSGLFFNYFPNRRHYLTMGETLISAEIKSNTPTDFKGAKI